MKRVAYHLTDYQIKALKAMSDRSGLAVAELLRRAVDALLKKDAKGREKSDDRS